MVMCKENLGRAVILQLMVVGQVGVPGRLVMNPAELSFKNAPESAHNQRPVMAGKRAKEKRGKSNCATCHPVLVSNETDRES